MKIKKKYSFTNNRQIWRILISDSDKLIIEDRDISQKQVYFNCLNLFTGSIEFRNLQFEEKYWIGIEAVYNNIIFFHKFAKPDMPGHKTIMAFDILSQQMLWQEDKYNFLFALNDKVYTYIQRFEDRAYFALDYLTGNLIEELGTSTGTINILRENSDQNDQYKNYSFPEIFREDTLADNIIDEIKKATAGRNVQGDIEYIIRGSLLLLSFHSLNSRNKLDNYFYCIDYDKGNTLLKEKINTDVNASVPDSFFIKDEYVFLLKEKNILDVYSFQNSEIM